MDRMQLVLIFKKPECMSLSEHENQLSTVTYQFSVFTRQDVL